MAIGRVSRRRERDAIGGFEKGEKGERERRR
jgi:hypothetical protein